MQAPRPASGVRPARRPSSRIALLLLGAMLLAPASRGGDILRGGATVDRNRKNADARGRAGAETADIAKTVARDRLARTTEAINAVRRMQQGAPALSVPDGLVPGGLKLATGLNARLDGANAPAQSGNAVTIKQTKSQAILHWETFNVGRNTTLNFDQSEGKADVGKWIAFNKVFDPTGVPSQILGSIKADGQVYILNQNGIIFGAGSQVNTRTLVASTLPINDNLIERGLLNQTKQDAQFLFSALQTGSYSPPPSNTATGLPGDVMVQRGASLSSPVSPEGYGGRIMLVGANVVNSGVISTPAGQTILAAGLQVGVQAHSTDDPSLRGLDVWVGAIDRAGLGTVGASARNAGIIEAPRGNITIVGREIFQDGAIISSTSVDLNGRVDLLANYNAVSNIGFDPANAGNGDPFLNRSSGTVRFGAESALVILPQSADTKSIASPRLPLRSILRVQARNIYAGAGSSILVPSGDVTFDAGTWIYRQTPPSSAISTFVNSSGQIYFDTGSLLDVSGSTDVFVPLADSILNLQLRGSELADSPLQRAASLRAVDLAIDLRIAGVYYGREWVGTPLGDLTGYLNLVERNVSQLTIEGGNISLSAGESVILRSGATIDASGGYVRNEGGRIQTTRLQLGRNLINVQDATPDRIYDGIYDGRSTQTSEKWGVTETYMGALSPMGTYMQKEYISGANAGNITISAPSLALDGQLLGRRILGPKQIRDQGLVSSVPRAGELVLNFEGENPNLSAFPLFAKISPTPPSIRFVRSPSQPEPAAFQLSVSGESAPLIASRKSEFLLPVDILGESGFGSLTIRNSDGPFSVSGDQTLTLSPGGSLSIFASNIEVDGTIIAPGGSVSLTAFTFSPYDAQYNQTGPLPSANPLRGRVRIGSSASISSAGPIIDDRVTSKSLHQQHLVLDGGSIALEAFSVTLERGSRLDASGGMFFAANGSRKYGAGGGIALLAGRDPETESIIGGKLVLDGAFQAFGKDEGGALSIRAMSVFIGEGSGDTSTFSILPSFFDRGGFSSFEIAGIGGVDPQTGLFLPAVEIAAGTIIRPSVANRISIPFDPAGRGALGTKLMLKPLSLRDSVALTFRGLGANNPFTGVPLAQGDIRVGEGSLIDAGPLGSVEFDGETAELLGSVFAPGGTIRVAGADTYPNAPLSTAVAYPTVRIGPSAVLSTAGTVVLIPDSYGRRRGVVLGGGTISIEGNIVAESGAILDVSGASGLIDLTPGELAAITSPIVPANSGLNAPLFSLQTTRTRIDSNGGAIILKGSELLLSDATLLGAAGGPTALGGQLSVSSGRFVANLEASTTADVNLIVTQSGNVLQGPTKLGEPVRGANGGIVKGTGYFSVDRFSSGGFSSLELGGNVLFSGNVSIRADRALLVGDGGIIETTSTVSLTAPYVKLGQDFRLPTLAGEETVPFTQVDANGVPSNYFPVPRSGSGSLVVNASLIDIGTLFLDRVSSATFSAPGGDIRGNGTLILAGDLTLRAGQIYPTTASQFDIFAYDNTLTAQPGSVTVVGSGIRSLPLSAGGSVRIMASTINQGGTIRAPFGSIEIGWDGISAQPRNDVVGSALSSPATSITQTLTLGSGSVTSVSGIDPATGLGILVPYGLAQDGLRWFDPAGLEITLNGLPEKMITLGAKNISTASGSVIDIRGGGDLLAYRWIQGTGGFEDILADDDSYAIVPGYNFGYSPFAPFSTSAADLQGNPGYANPNLGVGDTITLRGSAALPAGTYTLLPARYALLPGGKLVTPFNSFSIGTGGVLSNFQSTTPGNIQLEDGSFLVSGFRGNSFTPNRGNSPQAVTFQLLTAESIRAKSEYEVFSANEFLGAAALDRELTPQRLPADSGGLRFLASSGVSLNGGVLAASSQGGRGGFADISVPGTIAITGGGASAPPGSVELDASVLSSWGVESLLIGASRNGKILDVRASVITLDNGGSNFSGPEIVLAARQRVSLAAGAEITSSSGLSQPGTDFQIVGDGAFLRVTGDSDATISRTGVLNSPLVGLDIGAGAVVGGAGVTIDSTYDTDIDPLAIISGESVSLSSGLISILLDNAGSPLTSFGLVLEGSALESLANAGSLTLLSYTSLDLYGTGQLPLGNPERLVLRTGGIRGFNQAGGNVTIQARELVLSNPQGATSGADLQPASGDLIFDLETLRLGRNNVGIRQFENVILNAPGGVFGEGEGGIFVSGNLSGVVSSISASGAASQTISADGDLTLLAAAVEASIPAAGLGAELKLIGQSVRLDSNVVLPSGRLEITSLGGDVNLGGEIDLTGQSLTFFDVTRFTDGGDLLVSAALGDINATGIINVSAHPDGGNAGSVSFLVPDGQLVLNGAMLAASGVGGDSGKFALDASSLGGAGDFDTLNADLDSGGFFETRAFRARTGSVSFGGVARAREFLLFVDAGAATISGTIDAGGTTGGSIHIASFGDLTLTADSLLSVKGADFDSAGKGGSIVLEAGTQLGGAAGPGTVRLQSGAFLNLSVDSNVNGSAIPWENSEFWGQFAGTVHIRAPQNLAGNNLNVAPIDATIFGASSILVEGYKIFNLNNTSGVITNAGSINAAGGMMTAGQNVQGSIQQSGINFLGSGGAASAQYSSLVSALLANNASLESIVVLAPGAEIIKSNGSITLGSSNSTHTSDWDLSRFRFGPKYAPGVLTIRASGNVEFFNALSDGFDPTPSVVEDVIFNPIDVGSTLWLAPLTARRDTLPINLQSWSYRITAGADLTASNFRAVTDLQGSFLLGKNYGNANFGSQGLEAVTSSVIPERYQVVRTGSGSIDITAATDIQIRNQFASIYTVGTALSDASRIFSNGDFSIPTTEGFLDILGQAGVSIPIGYPYRGILLDGNGDPVIDPILGIPVRIPASAQYSMAGGSIRLQAGRDIRRTTLRSGQTITDSSRQLPGNWLYRRSYVDPATGEFGRTGAVDTSDPSIFIIDDPSASTTWWIDYSNFFQGVGSLGGGNIELIAGNDVVNVDAVAPTNARMTSGIPDRANLVEHGGGDILVDAGRDISGGVYYVERGEGQLIAGRAITTNDARSPSLGIIANLQSPTLQNPTTYLPTLLMVGKGGFKVRAKSDILIGPSTNPFLLPQGIGNRYWYKTYFSTYAPDSYINIQSTGGDITIRTEGVPSGQTFAAVQLLDLWYSAQTAINASSAAFYQPWLRLAETSLSPFVGNLQYSAPILMSTSISGSIKIVGDLNLSPSASGTLELVAADSITGLHALGTTQGFDVWKSAKINVSDANPARIPGILQPISYSTSSVIVDEFGLPAAGSIVSTQGDFLGTIREAFADSGATSGVTSQQLQARHAPGLLHANASSPTRLYAGQSDISGLTLLSPKYSQIVAGQDITDVAFYLQNTSVESISIVSAGRDISLYNTSTSDRVASQSLGNRLAFDESPEAGDIQISGPGAAQILAGRDLDLGIGEAIGDGTGLGISSVGNARNPFLPFAGASLFVGAGIGPSAGLANSPLEVEEFLDTYGADYPGLVEDSDYDSLSEDQSAQLALQILYLILRDTGRQAAETGSYEEGYAAIEALFGKTAMGGDINTRTREIRTRSGGEINLFAPGGDLILAQVNQPQERGNLASFAGTEGLIFESASTASAAPPGIVTEYGGGVSIFTKGNVDIGQARIFTLRGGNIIIWSSAGDIAAGSASKTVTTAPPTRVLIDPQSASVETDLSGLATGGGIGVLSTVEGVEPGDVDLIAPEGTVDAGDAGIRASGNLNIAAAAVLNTDNISAGGSTVGVPTAAVVAAPNIAGLASASSATGAANSSATQVANQARQQPTPEETPSVIAVEVLGYGGGVDEG